MSIADFLLFATATIGLTHILADPAVIFQPVRDWLTKVGPNWLNKLISCYQCCGTWVGFVTGAAIISTNPFVILACGMAGSFLASWAATYLNYLEAQSLVDIGSKDGESL